MLVDGRNWYLMTLDTYLFLPKLMEMVSNKPLPLSFAIIFYFLYAVVNDCQQYPQRWRGAKSEDGGGRAGYREEEALKIKHYDQSEQVVSTK